LNAWQMHGRCMATLSSRFSRSSRRRAGPAVGTSNMWALFSVLPGSERPGRGNFWSGGSCHGRPHYGWIGLDSSQGRNRIELRV
jgi:hypothetical protein